MSVVAERAPGRIYPFSAALVLEWITHVLDNKLRSTFGGDFAMDDSNESDVQNIVTNIYNWLNAEHDLWYMVTYTSRHEQKKYNAYRHRFEMIGDFTIACRMRYKESTNDPINEDGAEAAN
jgi:hypothetical protein